VIQAAKGFADRQSPILEQRALASFIVDGGFERHLRRMRVLYRARRASLLESLRRHIGDGLEVSGESAGMHLVVRLPLLETDRFIERARRAGVAVMSTAPHHLRNPVPGEFIFGFAEHDEATMEEAIARLGRILPECR
jgi:GntR family transcriptional regulator/MocR family aminotransferase